VDLKELKKALAGFCIAGLISGVGMGLAGCSDAGVKDDAGSVEKPRHKPGSG
jgi:radical SAM modification target selenobiotic family peptide